MLISTKWFLKDESEIAICGDEDDGFAEEESLEYILDYSGINTDKILDGDEDYLDMSKAGTSETCEHYNFNTLRKEK